MEVLYKGLPFILELSSSEQNIDLNALDVRLYNKATKSVFAADSVLLQDATAIAEWTSETTTTMPIGVYSLDIINSSTNEMFFHADNYLRCVLSSACME
ncbi:MAG: hypothetical protein NC035_09235 [Bacteroides sp.]|nr:hypothetical protein [Bacteroides sp.]